MLTTRGSLQAEADMLAAHLKAEGLSWEAWDA